MKYERILAVLATIICLAFIGLKLSKTSFTMLPVKSTPISGAFTYVSQNPLIAGGGIIIALIISSILWVLKDDGEKEMKISGNKANGDADYIKEEISAHEKADAGGYIKEEKGSQTLQKEEKENIGSSGEKYAQEEHAAPILNEAADIKEEKERKVAPKKEKEEIRKPARTVSSASPRQAFLKRQE